MAGEGNDEPSWQMLNLGWVEMETLGHATALWVSRSWIVQDVIDLKYELDVTSCLGHPRAAGST